MNASNIKIAFFKIKVVNLFGICTHCSSALKANGCVLPKSKFL